MHHTPLIAMIAAGFASALLLGMLASRLRLSPIVGYLAAGVLVGPYTPGFVGDAEVAAELAEIGVILLMFGVGLHFSYRDLIAVRKIALPGALVQILVATLLGMGLAWWLGWSPAAGLVFGLALSVASTVVLLRALTERQLLDTRSGHIAIGWLIVEDIAMVFALVLLPILAGALSGDTGGPGPLILSLGLTLAKLVAFGVLMIVVGRRLIPWLLARVVRTGSSELFTLSILAAGISIAYGASALFGVSFALGAFFAGMILKESELSHRAAADTLPLRDAFAVLFFVSVGMLFDPAVLVEQPLAVLATALIIIVGKSIAAFAIVKAFRKPTDTAVLISASLAQIGEFSFILVTLGLSLGLLPPAGRDLVLAGAVISIILNPLVFLFGDRARARRAAALAREVEAEREHQPYRTTASDHVIVVGYGRVGRLVVERMKETGRVCVVIEDSLERVEELRTSGFDAVLGNATRAAVLAAAGIGRAKNLIVTVPNSLEAGEIIARGRNANPSLRIVGRAQSDREIQHLQERGADRVIMGEREIARLMSLEV
ncbi:MULTISPECIES: YbaL family putative K(+) efflux transporter [Phenylobacterium]|uniref:CPA2 family monovalent cation:H+ antiporter-2 n=1 Tax=Phenylobacterium koreense TaxID=266125 RepID=A0ABV2EEN9_9CAUL|nr:YbaL family putative K(+) efflux transporter [Phenylobacterium sp. NIBR 498073]WGU41392.1 YbaL family putative K(+) efflux transporter [Phenylobacterium sp. NIBR 498073]